MKKLTLILFGLAFSNISYADPTYDVTKGALQNNSALCGYGYNPNCSSGRPPQKRIEYIDVLVPSKFGAIASSKEGLITGVLNMNSKEEAKKEAVAKCERDSGGSPCKVVTWVRNGCVAAAKGKLKGKDIVSTAGDEQGKVENIVLKQCKATGAAECQILLPEGCSIP